MKISPLPRKFSSKILCNQVGLKIEKIGLYFPLLSKINKMLQKSGFNSLCFVKSTTSRVLELHLTGLKCKTSNLQLI